MWDPHRRDKVPAVCFLDYGGDVGEVGEVG